MSSAAILDAAANDKLAQETDCTVTYRVAAGSFDDVEGQRSGGGTATVSAKCMLSISRTQDGTAEREAGDALIGQMPLGIELHAFDKLKVGTRTYLITNLRPVNGPTSLVWLVSIEAVPS